MLSKVKRSFGSKRMKYLLVITVGIIALVMQVGVVSLVAVQSNFGGYNCEPGGLQFSESYDQSDGTYDVKIVAHGIGTVESIHAVREDGIKSNKMDSPGESVVVEDLDPGTELRMIGVLDDGTKQIIQSYTVTE